MQVLKFSAPWCAPCRTLSPIFKKVSKEYPSMKFVDIDVDDNDDLVQEYSIKTVPTICIVDKGTVIGRYSGMMTEASMKTFIREHIQAHKNSFS